MKWMYEEIGAEAPFDDPDVVIKSKVGATAATSWHHYAARAIVALVRTDAQLRDAFALKDWPQPERILLTNDISNLILTAGKDLDTVADRIFARIRQRPSVDQQFDEMLTEDEIEQMLEDSQHFVREQHEMANQTPA